MGHTKTEKSKWISEKDIGKKLGLRVTVGKVSKLYCFEVEKEYYGNGTQIEYSCSDRRGWRRFIMSAFRRESFEEVVAGFIAANEPADAAVLKVDYRYAAQFAK